MDTWLTRCDILIKLGEYEAAVKNLFQAAEFYPECAEIEYRLAGVYYYLSEDIKAEYHLKNGLNFEPEFTLILEELFPDVFMMNSVKEIIKEHENPSL